MARDDWLDAGIGLLRTSGAQSLRVDRLAREVGLTKGSFHHHFAGAPDFRRQLLQRCTQQNADRLQETARRLAGVDPAAGIAALPQLVRLDLPLDRALRAWAVDDPEAQQAVARIDTDRITLLEGLWSRVVDDPRTARAAALIPYLVSVGAGFAAVAESDVDDVFALLARLVAAVPVTTEPLQTGGSR